MAKSSKLKRAYDMMALLAVLHMAALGGLGVYVGATGAVDREKIARMVAIFRGTADPASGMQEGDSVEGSSASKAAVEPSSDAKSKSASSRSQAVPSKAQEKPTNAMSVQELDIIRLEAERIQVELGQQLALVQGMMLKVSNEREAIRREREEASKSDDVGMLQKREVGFKKQVEIYSGLAAKVALDHLLRLDDPDQAARILMELEPRKAKKIVEAGRTPEQSRQLQIILQRIQDVTPPRPTEVAEKSN